MILAKSTIVAVLLAVGVTWGQSTAALSFEVASVKQAPPHQAWQRPIVGPDRIEFHNVTLWYCLSYAYGMKSYQMFGPEWLRETRYEIVAKGHSGTRREDLPEMVQTLLGERFKLQAHQETREIPVLALTPATTGPKLKEAPPESGDGQGGAQVGMSASASGGERLEIKGGAVDSRQHSYGVAGSAGSGQDGIDWPL